MVSENVDFVKELDKLESSICHMHGSYYSGYCMCPTCEEQDRADKEFDDE